MMHRYTRTTEPQPYDSVLFCGICHVEVHVTRWSDKSRVHEWSQGELEYWVMESERKARAHLEAEHPWRLWLYDRLGWRWLVGGLAP